MASRSSKAAKSSTESNAQSRRPSGGNSASLCLTWHRCDRCINVGARGLTDTDLARAYKSQVDPRLNYELALELAMRIADLHQQAR